MPTCSLTKQFFLFSGVPYTSHCQGTVCCSVFISPRMENQTRSFCPVECLTKEAIGIPLEKCVVNFNFQLVMFLNHFLYRCNVHFEIYVVHSSKIALFINLAKSFKFTLKYTIISLLHVSVFNDRHQRDLSAPN
jgi:hypothetical protein